MQAYYVAGIDVHKAMLAVVVSEVKPGECEFQRRRFGATRSQLRELTAWLVELGVQEVVMESTARYWRPVWVALEETGIKRHLAHAHSNGARRGRKSDFRDAERLVHRLVAGELVLSYVPEDEQQGWRWLTRTRYQLVCERGRVQSQIEGLLEDAQIKLSSVITDLLGASGRRILEALAKQQGRHEPAQLAALGHAKLRASREELSDALDGRWLDRHRFLLRLHLERIQQLDSQMEQIQHQTATAMQSCQEAVARLIQVPGIRTEGALQMLAEIGPTAAAFPSPEQMASWVGVCPGQQESAGQSYSQRSAKGNWQMRRLLSQAAHAAAHAKGSFFESLYRRLLVKIGPHKAIWAVAHRLCRLIWSILHQGIQYQERGQPTSTPQTIRRRQRRITAEFRNLGFQVHFTAIPTANT
jgi:transposase